MAIAIDPRVRFIVGNLHVGTRNREMLRTVRSKLSKRDRDSAAGRGERKLMYKMALQCHRENQAEYWQVMGGIR